MRMVQKKKEKLGRFSVSKGDDATTDPERESEGNASQNQGNAVDSNSLTVQTSERKVNKGRFSVQTESNDETQSASAFSSRENSVEPNGKDAGNGTPKASTPTIQQSLLTKPGEALISAQTQGLTSSSVSNHQQQIHHPTANTIIGRERRASLGNSMTSSSTQSSISATDLRTDGLSTLNIQNQSSLSSNAGLQIQQSQSSSSQSQSQPQSQSQSRSQSPQPQSQLQPQANSKTLNLNPVNLIPHLQSLSSIVADQQNQIITLIGAMSGTASLQSVHSLPSVSGGLRKVDGVHPALQLSGELSQRVAQLVEENDRLRKRNVQLERQLNQMTTAQLEAEDRRRESHEEENDRKGSR